MTMFALFPNWDTFLIGKSVPFFSAAHIVRNIAHLGREHVSHAPVDSIVCCLGHDRRCARQCSHYFLIGTRVLIGKSVTSVPTFSDYKSL
jgi:hypothetical protein